MPLKSSYIIRIACPIQHLQTLPAASDYTFLKNQSPSLAKIIDYLQSLKSPSLGYVGNYRAVCELQVGYETYTPLAGAHPTLGSIDKESFLPSIYLTTYADGAIAFSDIEKIVEEIVALHEWEHPVIEVTDPQGQTKLWQK